MDWKVARIRAEIRKSEAVKAEWEEAQKFNATNPPMSELKVVASKGVQEATIARLESLQSKLERRIESLKKWEIR